MGESRALSYHLSGDIKTIRGIEAFLSLRDLALEEPIESQSSAYEH